ncbi:MAG: CBS domain-containing protein, partial [Vicinamibacteria bacterium]
MRVGDYMTRDPITVEEDASMKEAMLLLRAHHIRHLPVATGKLLVGMVSDRDIKRASPSILQG